MSHAICMHWKELEDVGVVLQRRKLITSRNRTNQVITHRSTLILTLEKTRLLLQRMPLDLCRNAISRVFVDHENSMLSSKWNCGSWTKSVWLWCSVCLAQCRKIRIGYLLRVTKWSLGVYSQNTIFLSLFADIFLILLICNYFEICSKCSSGSFTKYRVRK